MALGSKIVRARLSGFVLLVVFGALVCVGGCSQPSAEQRYVLTGTIVDVDVPSQKVTIRHDAIAGYMDAMTMPFRVKDSAMMGALQPGRTVTAELVVADRSSWLENVVVSTAPGTPSLPSRVEGSTEPTPGEPAPDFDLVDQNGKRATLERFRGRAVALTFIYTRCPLPDYCPLMTDNFAHVAEALAKDPTIAAKTELLTISIDPDYDTPKVLRQYAARSRGDSDGANWDFLTGDPKKVREMAEHYGLLYEIDSDQIVHTLRTAVIAPDGRLIGVHRGNDWKPEELLRELRAAASD